MNKGTMIMQKSGKEVIQYEELVKEYNDSLNNVLRGFRPKYDFLELWVPDPDHRRSVINLVESAVDQGHKSFSIFFSKAILKELDVKKLSEELKKHGNIEQESQNGGKVLHLNRDAAGPSYGDTADGIDPIYKDKLLELQESITHRGSIMEDGGNLCIRSNKDGISLFGAIDTNLHSIHKACFSGTSQMPDSALLEGLCRIIQGQPIQEAYDHSVIKLEYMLRDKSTLIPVKGILNVFNYPPLFDLPLKLIRDLYATYIQKTGYKPGDNFFFSPVSQKWKALPDSDKAQAITRVFKSIVDKKPYSKLKLELIVTGIELHHKINIDLQGDITPVFHAKLYLDFETALRRELEPGLEVFSHNIKDKNAIRRMN